MLPWINKFRYNEILMLLQREVTQMPMDEREFNKIIQDIRENRIQEINVRYEF